MAYIPLPAFRAPGPLDFSPLAQGIAEYKEGQTRNALFNHQKVREGKQDARQAVADSRATTEFEQGQETFAAGKRDRAAKALAATLQSISALPPEQQGPAYQAVRTNVKDYDDDVRALGGNPDDYASAARVVTSHVEGYLSRADKAAIDKDQAQTELARAQAANEQYKPVPEGSEALYSTRDGSLKPLGAPNPDGTAAAPGGLTKPKDVFMGEEKLRTEFNALHKDFRTVRDSYSTLKAVAKDPSPGADVALVFAFMKILDPNSVVRETEFATAENVGSIPTRVWTQYNKAMTGQRLDPEVRKDFVAQAQKVYGSREQSYVQSRDQYRSLAERSRLNPQNVIIDQNLPADVPPQNAASSIAGAAPGGQAPSAPSQGAAPGTAPPTPPTPQPGTPAPSAPDGQPPQSQAPGPPPVEGARWSAKDGAFYIPDPRPGREGKFVRVDP
jgi:hypothetical protein